MRVNTLVAELNFAVSALKSALPMEQRITQPAVSRVVANNEPAYFAWAAAALQQTVGSKISIGIGAAEVVKNRCRWAPLTVGSIVFVRNFRFEPLGGGVSIEDVRQRTAIFVMAGPFPFPVQG